MAVFSQLYPGPHFGTDLQIGSDGNTRAVNGSFGNAYTYDTGAGWTLLASKSQFTVKEVEVFSFEIERIKFSKHAMGNS